MPLDIRHPQKIEQNQDKGEGPKGSPEWEWGLDDNPEWEWGPDDIPEWEWGPEGTSEWFVGNTDLEVG